LPRSSPASPPTVALETNLAKPNPPPKGTATAAPLSPAPNAGATLDRLDGNTDNSNESVPEHEFPGSSNDTEGDADETDHLATKPEETDDTEVNLEAVDTNKVHKTTVGLRQSDKSKENDSSKEVPNSGSQQNGEQRDRTSKTESNA